VVHTESYGASVRGVILVDGSAGSGKGDGT
jgi:hypothetical protein